MLKINKALVHYKQIWSTDSRKYGALPNRIHKFNNWKAFRSRPCRSRYLITDLSVMKMITSPGMSAYSFTFRRRQFAIMWHRVATQCDRSSPADLQVSMCGTLFAGLLSHFVCREEGTTIPFVRRAGGYQVGSSKSISPRTTQSGLPQSPSSGCLSVATVEI